MKDLLIRKVASADNIPLAMLIRNVFEEFNAPTKCSVYSDPATDDLYSLFQETGAVLWVAILNNEIAGCCGIYPTEGLPENYAEMAKFYLLKNHRGKGIGKQLMKKCFESAKQIGYKNLYLESMPQFSDALSMYEKYGFKKLYKSLGNSGHTACNIWMLKEL